MCVHCITVIPTCSCVHASELGRSRSPLLSSISFSSRSLAHIAQMASSADAQTAHPSEQQRIANKVRFETELEVRGRFISFSGGTRPGNERGTLMPLTGRAQFVSCLANPFYLQCAFSESRAIVAGPLPLREAKWASLGPSRIRPEP